MSTRAAWAIVAGALLLGLCACGVTTRGVESGEGSPAVLRPLGPIISESWTFQGNTGMAYSTTHYRVLTTVERGVVRDRLPRFAEASLARFSAAFPELPEPSMGLEVFVLSSRPEWERFVTEVYGADGLRRYGGIERGGFAERGRAVLWDIGVQDTLAILAHEGWHQYTQATLREPLPAWLEEGLGCWAEGFRWDPVSPERPVFLPWANVERFDQLRRAAQRGGLLPLEQLLTERPEQLLRVSAESTLTYYAQCWALSLYLQEDAGRRDALGRLLADAASGRVRAAVRARYGDRAARSAMLRRSGTEVWTTYFGSDLAAEGESFARFIARVVEPGSKGEIVRGESPVR